MPRLGEMALPGLLSRADRRLTSQALGEFGRSASADVRALGEPPSSHALWVCGPLSDNELGT